MAGKPQPPPTPPKGTRAGGARLWRDVLGKYELEEHELALLREAVRTVDQLDRLNALVERDGLIVEGPHGSKANPAVTAANSLRICLARILAALRLPAGDQDDAANRRPQRRVGVRGVYELPGA
jgi:hypothetical protein